MSELLPTRQAKSIEDGLLDYLATTFALADDDARLALLEFLGDADNGLFKGPFLRLRLPFRPASGSGGFSWNPDFVPYGHQASAFARLSSAELGPERPRPLPTVITTGTGSGKTEAFLYPILDHVLRARRAGVTGMKALILYPMNALANDQATRLTELLTTREELAGITAALYTGQDGPQRTKVTRDGLITDRAIIRDSAPDLLLTNYKMLDQLLLRSDDQRIWQQSALSLQYLVLDEFHTYDGAQGTDVAMLLRRLGLTVKSHWPADVGTDDDRARPLGRITPVATSATLGDQGDPGAMLDFAATVFGETLDASCVIGEERLTLQEWVGEAPTEVMASGFVARTPARADLASINTALDTAAGDAHQLAVAVVAALYDVTPSQLTARVGDDPVGLLPLLRAHPLVHTLVAATGQAVSLADLGDLVFPDPPAPGAPDDDHVSFLTHVVAALSHVRARVGRAALTVDLHLWVRELTRIDRVAGSSAEYLWSDDGTLAGVDGEDPFAGQTRPVFPAIYCRHCGRSGWGVELAAVGSDLAPEDTAIRRHHASREGRFRALLYAPLEAEHASTRHGDSVEGLHWFSIRQRALVSTPPVEDDRDTLEGWVLPVLTHVGADAEQASRDDTCPSCQSKDAIRFLGSAVATLLSVTLSTLFGSEDLDAAEKKALVFTDSVQDAAHRAGFVESRSHVLTLRSLLRDAVGNAPITLDALVGQAVADAGDDRFRRFRLVPPDLATRDEFAPFWRKDTLREVPSIVLTRVRRRLLFDAVLEFGLQSRFGRTLEQTGSVVVEVEAGLPAKLATLGRAALEKADLQASLDDNVAAITDATLVAWVRGTLEHMREGGAIEHEWLNRFLKEDGNRYRIWGGRPRGQGMPAFPSGRSAPAFPRVGPAVKWRDPLLDPVTSPQSWYARWAARNLGVQAAFGAKLARLLLEALVHGDVLHAVSTDSGGTVFAIPTSSVLVQPTTEAGLASGRHLLVCTVCHNQQPGTASVVGQLEGAPCMLVRCPGRLEREPRGGNYYRTLYASADMRRIVAREHSSLLDDTTRLAYEGGFKEGQTRPDAPNVLVATPTLELGIDIGDLSAVLLASLPKTVTSYLQRVGRAGRLTGNALNLAFVTGRGVNLQRWGDPLSVVNGPVRPPATYLSAQEILRRQYVAHLLDCLARDPQRPHPRLASVVMQATPGSFLEHLVGFAETGSDAHLDRFLGAFSTLSTSAVDGLRSWATASDGPGTSSLGRQVFAASQRWNTTVEGLSHRKKAIEDALPELDQVAALPAASDDDKRAARSALAALKVTNKELANLRGEYWISVLEEFGLLPNYTLLDDSVTLEVSLTWVDPDTSEYQYESTSLQRASANALREFAPGSTFYARGLEISIDTVDLGVGESAIHTMAFCPTCGYAADLGDGAVAGKGCPRCGDLAIGGIEHHLDVVELSRVSAEMNRDEAQISDRTDERKQERFSIFVAADINPEGVAKEWYVDQFSFGVKYLNRVDVRWVNAGRAHGPLRQIAGIRGAAPLFRLCEGCGKLDRHSRSNSRGEHRPWCRYRKSDDEHTRDLALTRSMTTQGAVLRLPLTVTLGDRFALPSLSAAVALGMAEQIGGLPDHIEVASINVPVTGEGGGSTVEALLLHDVVPGGTGYLAELADPERVWDLLFRAWQRLKDCECANGPHLACHRCLLPYASGSQVDLVSRAAAERHLRDILGGGVRGFVPEATMQWTVTEIEPVMQSAESHLEQRFRKLFTERLTALGATLKEVPGQWGNTVSITFPHAVRQWTLEPQVQMGGVRPDFVLRSSQHNLPAIAIFTDGWRFHAVPANNTIADDAQKRRMLRAAGTMVLSITWADLERDANLAQGKAVSAAPPAWYDAQVISALMQQSADFGADHVEAITKGPLDFLLGWIQAPDLAGHEALGNRVPWLFAKDGAKLALDPDQDLAQAAAHLLLDTQPPALPARAATTSWWWRSGHVGVLTRARQLGAATSLESIAVLDDRPDHLGDGHRSAWEEWLRLGNVLGIRTQPTEVVALSELISGTVPLAGEVTEPGVPGLSTAWQEVVDGAASDAERRVLQGLAAIGRVPVPQLGFETPEGSPIDIAWPDLRVAADLDLDEPTRQELLDLGWTMVTAEVDALVAALAGPAGDKAGTEAHKEG